MVLRRQNKAKRSLTILKFDELNAMQEVDELYAGIEEDCRQIFRELYEVRYEELWQWLKGKQPDEDMLDELADTYLAGLWDDPNELTHYAFHAELVRKRDRAKEAILAVPTKAQKQLELEKAVKYAMHQTAFYVDIVEDGATRQCYEDAGVKKVRWMVYGDDRVCSQCESLNGTVWDLDRVPDKPHLRCRCYLVPVT